MSVAGIDNAAVGTVIVDLTKNLLTPIHNKPATKKIYRNYIKHLINVISQ